MKKQNVQGTGWKWGFLDMGNGYFLAVSKIFGRNSAGDLVVTFMGTQKPSFFRGD